VAKGITIRAKRMFFDRKKVQDILGKQSAKALGKAGAFVQRRARSSLRRRKAASAPGSPPNVHSQDDVATLKNIWFALDEKSLSVVVGPLKLNQQQYLGGVLTAGTVPQLHEFGGTAGIREKRVGKSWHPVGRRGPRPGQPTRVRRAQYPPRPWMGPAMVKEAPNFPSLWLRAA
jgi:hypothetical protein